MRLDRLVLASALIGGNALPIWASQPPSPSPSPDSWQMRVYHLAHRGMPVAELVKAAGPPRARVGARCVDPGSETRQTLSVACELWLFVSPTCRERPLAELPLDEVFIANVVGQRLWERRFMPTQGMLDMIRKSVGASSRSSPSPDPR